MRRHTSGFGPTRRGVQQVPMRFQIGVVRLPWCSRYRIGLLLLAVMVLTWPPRFGPLSDRAPARWVRGIGDFAILTFAFAPDGRTIATIQTDGRVALLDAAGDGGGPVFLDHRGNATCLAFSPDGRSLAVGGPERDVWLYDLKDGGAGRPLGMGIIPGYGMAFSPDGHLLAVTSYLDHEIILWDLATGRERTRLRGHRSVPIRLAFAADGRSLASAGRSDDAILLWDPTTGRLVRRLGIPPGPVTCLAYSPDGHWLAAGRVQGLEGRLWDLEGQRGDRPLGIVSRGLHALAISPDGRLLTTADDDGVVRLRSLATGAGLGHVGGPGDRLIAVAFSPDGRLLAVAGSDADIRLWDVDEILKRHAEP